MQRSALRFHALATRALEDGESDEPFRRWVQVVKVGRQWLQGYASEYDVTDDDCVRMLSIHEHLTSHGERVIFDVNHGSLFGAGVAPLAQQGKVGHVVSLAHRKGEGVWALGEFTADGEDLIRHERLDMTSPELHYRFKSFDTGKMESGPALLAVALTARPQLLGMQPIAAATRLALSARFGLDDVDAVERRIHSAVDALAMAGSFGTVRVESSPGSEPWQYDVRAVKIDPDWTWILVHNIRTDQHFLADLSDQDGALVISNIGEADLRAVRKPAPASQEPIMAAATTPRTLEQAEARIAELEAKAAEADKAAPVVAALADVGVTTPEAVKALALRPDVGAFATLQAQVSALGGELQTKTGELQALSARFTAIDEDKRKLEATALVERYEKQGKITPATRPDFVALALANPAGFTALADKLPVVVNIHQRGTGGDVGDEPETLHALAMRRVEETRTSGSPVNYAVAIDLVTAERPDLLAAWRQDIPGRR